MAPGSYLDTSLPPHCSSPHTHILTHPHTGSLQPPDPRLRRQVQPEYQVDNRSHKAGEELPEDQSEEEGQGAAVAVEATVSQDEDLGEPASKDGQPQPEQPETPGDKVASRVEGPPWEPGSHEG